MRALGKAAIGGTLVSAATVGGLVVGGVFATTATLVVTDPLAPRASADSLARFDSCAALLRWYVDHSVPEVGPWGWHGPIMYATDTAVTLADSVGGSVPAAKGATPERASSGTGTNTQEADVDEPDVAKTDGRRVVRLVDQRVVVISDVTGAQPRELGRVSLPVDTYGGELLLVADHVLVSQPSGGWSHPVPLGAEPGVATPEASIPDDVGATNGKALAYLGGTRIIDIDISDPAEPRIVHDDSYTGQQVSLRQYGDTVRLVTATDLPALRFVMPGMPGHRKLSDKEATRRNRALVRATTIDDWVPRVVDNLHHTAASRLVDCDDVYHPGEWSGGQTTTVTTYDVGQPAARRSVGITADGQVVYSSADRLYVTSTRYDEPRVWRHMFGSGIPEGMMPIRQPDVTTRLHAFALDGLTTRYVGSGHVTGSVRDRWSLDEHDGKLRVAWTRQGRRGGTDNGITVLSEKGGALVPTGTIDRLGRNENIQSVRWFDDLAVLVTFRQMDPLYTIDLSDQDHPKELGSLKIPGYSGYLHPIGDDLLLGLGVDATAQGESLGSQAAIFDIGDLTHPRRLSRQGFGPSSLPALEDPRGFTWLPDRRTGLTTVAGWSSDRARLVALHVTASGALQAHDLATRVGWNTRTLPLADGRVAVVDDNELRVLDVD